MKFFLILTSFFALSKDLQTDLNILASQEYEGRVPGSIGIDKAADYIKSRFEQIGLKAINGSYFHEFEIEKGKKLTGKNTLSFNLIISKPGIPKNRLNPRKRVLEVNSQYLPLSISRSGTYSGELVFVGYGINSESLDYNDYEGIDVSEKAVLILEGSPDANSEQDRFSRYASLNYKLSTAKKNNAKAIIYVMMQGDSADVFTPLTKGERVSGDAGIPVIQAKRDDLSKIFPRDKQLNVIAEKINETKKPQSFVIPKATVELEVNLEPIKIKCKNVLGLLENNSKENYFYVGAHYDHLGLISGESSRYKGKEPKMHLGADDNASGIAGIIELATRLKKNKIKENVIFAAWSAEEMGLLGSKDYVTTQSDIVSKTRAYFNFDMIGRLGEKDIQVMGTGSASEFETILDTKASEMNIKVKKISAGTGNSDHSSFYTQDKPVLAFFTGVHADYHTPDDTPDKIDFDGMKKVIDYAESVIREIDNQDNLTFTKVVANPKASIIRRGSSKVRMGVIPNYYDTDHGFVIEGVSAGGAAANAGLKADDIILEIDGTEIRDIYDFMYSYWEKNPGDIVKVKILREGRKKPFVLNVELEGKY